MSADSKIEWTDATWNVVIGCDKVSPGCDHCYAIRTAHRMQANPNEKIAAAYAGTEADGEWTGKVNLLEDRLDMPLRWTKPKKIFVNAQSDLFHADVPDEFIAHVWAVMALAPQHTFQILTKRPGRMRSLVNSQDFKDCVNIHYWTLDPERPAPEQPWPLRNVWLGVSVEDQKRADLRIPALLGTSAAVRFLSCEPLLGPVDLTHMDLEGRLPGAYWINALSGVNADMGRPCPDGPSLDWIIVGGESGPGARPMHSGWVQHLRDQCTAADVAFHFKQWGNFAPVPVESAQPGDIWVLGRGLAAFDSPRQGELSTMPTQAWGPETRGAEPGKWDRYGDALVRPMHKRLAGRELDGRTWDEFPQAVTA